MNTVISQYNPDDLLTASYSNSLESKMRLSGTPQQIAVVETICNKYNCEWAVAVELMKLAAQYNRPIYTFVK
jgi:hypothetical protein